MEMQQLRVLSVLLVSLSSLFITISKANLGGEIRYKLRISEKGSRFSERVTINEKKNTVTFTVPKHNDVESSEVLNDFNQNLTITRLPDQGMCYIQPLDKSQPHPREMKSNMDYIRKTNAIKGKESVLVTSTQWTWGKQLKEKELTLSVVKFCAGLPIYRLKEITEDSWKVEQNSTNGKVRRDLSDEEFQFCNPISSYSSSIWDCKSGNWKLRCKITRKNTCVYWVKCRSTITIGNYKTCTRRHKYDSVVCCNPSCS